MGFSQHTNFSTMHCVYCLSFINSCYCACLFVWKRLTTHQEEQSRHVLHEPAVPTASQHSNDPAEQDDGHGHSHESRGHSPQICGRRERRQVKHGDSELIGGTACIRWVRWLIVNEHQSASVDPKWLWFSSATFPGRDFKCITSQRFRQRYSFLLLLFTVCFDTNTF